MSLQRSWSARGIAPPLAIACLAPAWSQGQNKTSQRHRAGRWRGKPNLPHYGAATEAGRVCPV
eukprot:350499-Chlamydomonas_euryale.AAC.4